MNFILNLTSLPNAGQPVCSQAKHTHQQHQYGRSILNVVVQFASNPTQTEQPDHLQRAEQTADALETGRKTEMGISISQRVDSVLVSRQFCYRNEHAFTHQTPRAHSFHIKNANVEPDSNPGQLRTELCPWNKGIILFLVQTFYSSVLHKRKTKHSTETSPLTCKWQKCKHKDGKRTWLNALRSI